MRAIMVIGIVGIPIAWVVLSRLLRIVEAVRTGEPFTMDNADTGQEYTRHRPQALPL